MERPAGIGPVYTAWEAIVLPLNYGRINIMLLFQAALCMDQLENRIVVDEFLTDKIIRRFIVLIVEAEDRLDTCTSRDQLTDHDVLLQALKEVFLALDGSIGQDSCCLLEGCGRKEGISLQGRLGDTENNRKLALEN